MGIQVSGLAMEIEVTNNEPMVVLEEGGNAYDDDDDTYNKTCSGICCSVTFAIAFSVFFIFSAIFGAWLISGLFSKEPTWTWSVAGPVGIAVPTLFLLGAIISCCCCSNSLL